MKIYKNYGMLGREKMPIYTVTPGELADEIEVILPEGMALSYNEAGAPLVEENGRVHLLSSILATGENDEPILRWTDGANWYRKQLKEN